MDAPAAKPLAVPERSPLLLAGLGGAGLSVAVTLIIGWAGWGQPGTEAYETYELLNRVTVLPMLLMTAVPVALLGRPNIRDEQRGTIAAVALLVGLLAMAIGTSAEFWVFTDQPYGGAGSEGRISSYVLGTFLGGMVALIALALLGSWGLRRRTLPRWTALTLTGLPVALVVLAFTPLSPYLAIPVGMAILVIGLLALDR